MCSKHPSVTGIGPIFVDLINDKRKVAIYQEAFNAELNGNAETMETGFVLGGVIGDRKMNPKDILEFVPRWEDKKHTCPSTVKVEGAIEVHDPVLGSVG